MVGAAGLGCHGNPKTCGLCYRQEGCPGPLQPPQTTASLGWKSLWGQLAAVVMHFHAGPTTHTLPLPVTSSISCLSPPVHKLLTSVSATLAFQAGCRKKQNLDSSIHQRLDMVGVCFPQQRTKRTWQLLPQHTYCLREMGPDPRPRAHESHSPLLEYVALKPWPAPCQHKTLVCPQR